MLSFVDHLLNYGELNHKKFERWEPKLMSSPHLLRKKMPDGFVEKWSKQPRLEDEDGSN